MIFALLLGGEAYGFLGALLALPIAAMLRETVVYLRRHLVLEPWGTASVLGSPGRRHRRAAVRSAARRGARRHVLPHVRRGAGAHGSSLPPVNDAVAALEARDVIRRFGEREALRGVSFRAAAARRWRSSGPTARARRRCCRSSAGVLAPSCRDGEPRRRATSAGCRSSRRSTASSRSPRTCALFARLERVADPDAAVARMLDQTGPARPRRRRARHAVGRQPPARQHRRRPARRPRRAAARRAVRRRWTRASASGCGSFVGGLARARHGGRVHHPQRRRGRALRRPRARARRRRAALRGHARARCTRRSASDDGATSRRRSSRSCGSAATERRALPAGQGPADPAPLAAVGGAAGRLSRA